MLHTINSFTQLIFHMSKKKVLVHFGEKVRELRKEKGLSQEELSYKSDLHRTYIGMIERAEKNITLVNIEKIAKGLNIELKDFFSSTKK
jgi:transcriptional regulator with XRE-family HTH domain